MDVSRLRSEGAGSDRTEQLLELLLELGGLVGAALDTELRHEWVHNPNPEPPESEILGRRDDELYPEADAEPTMTLKRDALARDERVEREFIFRKPWEPVAYQAVAEPVHDEDGEQTGVLFAAFDRTERYQLLDRTTDAVFTVDTDWVITFWNERMAERTGLSAVDVTGERIWDLDEDVPEQLEATYREAMASGESVELEQYIPEPFDYWVEVRVFPDENGLTVFSRDVSETVERTRELERQQYLFEEIQEIADIGVWEYDVATEELWWSDGVYRIHEMDPESADPPTVETAIERYHPEDRPRIEGAFERAMTTGEEFTLELRLANPDGGVRDIRSQAEVVSEDGETVFVRGTIQDITAVKRTERSLRQQNERLDDFVDLVAHDLRNPLSVASAFTDLAIENDSVEELDRVRTALDRMDGLLGDMLAAARAGQSLTETAPVDVAGLARSAWENVDTGDAELHVEEGLGLVQGEYGRLLRLFENLVGNAVEHGGPAVTVTVGPLPDDAGFYVEDDGPGIPPDDRDRVFDRGYSTNREGTGFGLAIVADVVAVHGWTIDLTESPAGGARFEVTVSAAAN